MGEREGVGGRKKGREKDEKGEGKREGDKKR